MTGLLSGLAGAVGVGGATVGSILAAVYLYRALRVGSRLATWATFGVVALILFGVGSAAGYVDGGRLLGDLWQLAQTAVDVAVPAVRSLLGSG